MLKNSKKKGLSTRAIHAGQEPDKSTGAIMVPIYATSTYIQKSPGEHLGFEYSRTQNPTRTAYEKCVADLESGEFGFAFASGMAAADTILSLLKVGDEVLAIDDLYGGTRRLFEKVRMLKSGITFKFINYKDFENVNSYITKNTKMIWVETPTNPMLTLVDLKQLGAIKGDIIKVVDNTFASPINQRPLEFNIDIVMHSATKYLNGHSDMIGGVAITNSKKIAEFIVSYLKNSGLEIKTFGIDNEKKNVVASAHKGSNRSIVFNSHIDTVRPIISEWKSNPFDLKIEKNYSRCADYY